MRSLHEIKKNFVAAKPGHIKAASFMIAFPGAWMAYAAFSKVGQALAAVYTDFWGALIATTTVALVYLFLPAVLVKALVKPTKLLLWWPSLTLIVMNCVFPIFSGFYAIASTGAYVAYHLITRALALRPKSA